MYDEQPLQGGTYVFARGAVDGRVLVNRWGGVTAGPNNVRFGWSGWFPIPGTPIGPEWLSTSSGSGLDVWLFLTTADRRIVAFGKRTSDYPAPNQPHEDWFNTDEIIKPFSGARFWDGSAATDNNARFLVSRLVEPTNQLWFANGRGDWRSLGIESPSAAGVVSSSDTVFMFVRGNDNVVRFGVLDIASQTLTPWIVVAGTTDVAPAVAPCGLERDGYASVYDAICVFARGIGDHAPYMNRFEPRTQRFSGWMKIPGDLTIDGPMAAYGTRYFLWLVARSGGRVFFNTKASTYQTFVPNSDIVAPMR
jgi:hypothetical protein